METATKNNLNTSACTGLGIYRTIPMVQCLLKTLHVDKMFPYWTKNKIPKLKSYYIIKKLEIAIVQQSEDTHRESITKFPDKQTKFNDYNN